MRTTDSSKAPPRRSTGGKRSLCRGFSGASRRRMLELGGAIDLREVGAVIFATLTARAGTMDWHEVERRRRVWFERLKRRWSGYRWFAIWKKEPHASGEPHLHVLIYFVGGLVPHLVNDFRPWNDRAWSEVCGEPSICRTELIRNKQNGVAWYLAKYCAKPFQESGCGRVWGVENRKLLPLNRETMTVARGVLTLMQRALVKLRRKRSEVLKVFDPVKREWVRGTAALPGVPRTVLERLGYKCRFFRPRCYRTHRRTIWFQDEETRKLEPGGEERESFAPSLHFADADLVRRLLKWAEAEYLRRLADDLSGVDLPPF